MKARATPGSGPEGRLLADAHVHFYPSYDRDAFLGTAWDNLAALAKRAGFEGAWMPYLLLTESRDYDYFETWKTAGDEGEWTFEQTQEPVSLLARGPEGRTIAVIRGRQVRARSGLEVLALGTDETPEDGLEFTDALRRASDHAAFACIPWGFGKWWFARGSEVRGALASKADNVCLGENAGRPWMAPIPRLFKLARREGVPILPGSDPLPLAWHWNRAGRLAFSVPGTPDPDRPLRSLAEAVGRGVMIETLGRGTGLGRFLIDQIALRLVRRGKRAR